MLIWIWLALGVVLATKCVHVLGIFYDLFAGCVKDLHANPKPIRDHDETLQPFCETLELIFRKGLKRKLCTTLICFPFIS